MIQCQFESGSSASLRHAVVDALIIRDDEILLTKRAASLHGAGLWALPGGFVERDETVAEAVMREVLEETGYTSEVKELVTVLDSPERRGEDRQNISFVFLVDLISQVQDSDDNEIVDMEWWPLAALPEPDNMAFDHLEIIWEWIKQRDELLSESLNNVLDS